MKTFFMSLTIILLCFTMVNASDVTHYVVDYANGHNTDSGHDWTHAWREFDANPESTDAGDTIMIAKSPDPINIGNVTWTDSSGYLTLASALTLTIEDCEDAWTASANVTDNNESAYEKEGSYGRDLYITSTFTTGLVAYETISETDFSDYSTITFWIRSSANHDANVFSMKLCSDTEGATPVDSVIIDHAIKQGVSTPIAIEEGTLGSSIQSVALYIRIDQDAYFTINLDNIEACTDSLNLRTLISKRTTTGSTLESFYPIRSIKGTQVILGNNEDHGSQHIPYGGTSETVTSYTWLPIPTDIVAFTTTDVFAVSDTGGIYYIGGYNTSTGVHESITLYDGQCDYGEGLITSTSTSSLHSNHNFQDLGFVRYYQGMGNAQHQNQNYCTFKNIHLIGSGYRNLYHTDSWFNNYISLFVIGAGGDGINLEDENNDRWDTVFVIGNVDGIVLNQADKHTFTYANLFTNWGYAVSADPGVGEFQQNVDNTFRHLTTRNNDDGVFEIYNSYILCEDVSISESNVVDWLTSDNETQSRSQGVRFNKWDNNFWQRILYRRDGTISDQVTGGMAASWAYGGSGTCDFLQPTNLVVPLEYTVAFPIAKGDTTDVTFYVRKTSSGATPELYANVWGSGVREIRDTLITLTDSWVQASIPQLIAADSGFIFVDFRAYSDTGGIGIDQYEGGLLADFTTADWTRWAYVTGGMSGYFNTADWTMWAYADGGVTDLSLVTCVKQDTFWVHADGALTQWEPSVFLADRWRMIEDYEACNTDSFIYESTEGQEESFKIVSTCPDDYETYLPFLDSVNYHWCGLGTNGGSGQNLLKLGFYEPEGVGYKSDSVTYAIGTSEIEIEHSVPDDNGDPWNTYRFYDDEWVMKAVEIEDFPPAGQQIKCYTAFIVSYQTYPETLTDGSDALALYQADTSIVSEWSLSGCSDINECLKTIQCDAIYTSTANKLYLFGHEEISLDGTKIDSLVTLLCGYHNVGGDSSVGIFYGVVAGSDTTVYGLDTLTLPGLEKNGSQQMKVWSTCPATDTAWTAADLNDNGKGFGFKTLHANGVAVTVYRLLMYLSETEAPPEEEFPARIVLYNGEIKKVCEDGITQIIY